MSQLSCARPGLRASRERHQLEGGGLFGYTDLYGGYDAGQAEYVGVPFADVGPREIDADVMDEQFGFMTDILPTGYTAVDWAGMQGGETVAVIGCGPAGLSISASSPAQRGLRSPRGVPA
ncbi:hypothetical protein WMF18_34570 [Sorangium sp. So ce315]|uniref:hypothetical protein n=1 Tax=Sorangium sp. So ce315 TaxID=3133299 RepID=UPI003F5F1B68